MKRIIWIVIIIAALAGCNEKRHPLLKEAAVIIHQRPDSALALISRMDTASLSETERIEYCLLKVMMDFLFIFVIIYTFYYRNTTIAKIFSLELLCYFLKAACVIPTDAAG